MRKNRLTPRKIVILAIRYILQISEASPLVSVYSSTTSIVEAPQAADSQAVFD